MRSTLLAKSSSGEPYQVVFDLSESGLMTVGCPCAAGQANQLCKHVLAFLEGDASMLFRPADEQEALAHLLKIVAACEIGSDCFLMQTQLRELDQELKRSKTRIEKERRELKATFARKLREGYPVS